MRLKDLKNFLVFLLLLLIFSGLYLFFSQAWTLFYKCIIIFHPACGVFVFAYAAGRVLHATRHGGISLKNRQFRKLKTLLHALFVLVCLTGLRLFLPSLPTSGFYVHRNASFAFMFFCLFALIPFVKERRKEALLLLTVTTLFIFCLSILLKFENRPLKTFSVNLSDLLAGPPASRGVEAGFLNTNTSCGEKDCHSGILKDHLRSAHFLSPKMPYIQSINALLEKQKPASGARWCSGCHFPQEAFAVNFSFKDRQGISCVFCHSVSAVRMISLLSPGERKKIKKGYDVSMNVEHLQMFPRDFSADALSSIDRFLIRIHRLGHGRVFSRRLYKDFSFCMPCHEENIPPPEAESVVRPNCIDCHMTDLKVFSESGVRKPHLFLGGNNLIPYMLGDRELLSITERFMAGNFSPVKTDSFWTLRQSAGEPPPRATWLILTMEPLTPPVPGKPCKIRLYTSNPGIGHPFPTGALHLFDIWLDIRVETQDGKEIYRNGKRADSVKNYFKDGTHRLGGVMLDAAGHPIDGPIFWDKKSMEKRWVEWGKTITDEFVFDVPENAGDYVVVSAAWHYARVNKEFSPYVFGKTVDDFRAVTMASVSQRVPVEPVMEQPSLAE